MPSSNNKILRLFKSRKTILELLETQGYDVSEYKEFNINEVDAMNTKNQLDLTFTNKTTNKSVYVKYYLESKQIKPNTLDNIIEDLYEIEGILTKNDTLIIITEDEPNDTIINKIKFLFNKDGIFVVIHNIQRLQFNILEHQLVPKGRIMSDEELSQLKENINITDLSQLPEISRFDPQALAMCIRPGEVCELLRNSVTSVETTYYRACV
uniref:RNA polymerase subunit H/Rpb5 C-terminal domain-containing protein n=1 Tax=viral metagenome TaxID=1070528 RepID=A0A6C0ISG4_9ZZZZ